LLDAADTRSLALLYHLNSDPWPSESFDRAFESRFKQMAGAGESVRLPATEASPVEQVIRRRSSCRRFADTGLPLVDLAATLAGSYGLGRALAYPGRPEARARPVPSAGALYPLELYAVLRRVESVDDGLYHYNARDHALEPLKLQLGRSDVRDALLAAPLVENANAIVLVTAVLDRTLDKYGARGYRYVLLEAGHTAQNLCLLATERGLATLCVGGFRDAAVQRFLGLDPRAEVALYSVAVGHAHE
jgi:SagB-type dehydrogenase family enzyme